VAAAGDCDDTDPAVHPAAPEICNDRDDDCDGLVDTTDPDCSPPEPAAGGPYAGDRTQTVELDGRGSLDRDGVIVTYEWLLDGEMVYTGTAPTYALELAGRVLGSHTITIVVTDNAGCTGADTAVLEVTNAPPRAADDAVVTDEDEPVTIDLTSNDTDGDGTVDPTTVAVASGPSHGSVTVGVSGTVTYAPDPNYHGADGFSYTVDDNDGAPSNEATVSITVRDVNDPPVAVDDEAATEQGTGVRVAWAGNDFDIDGRIEPTSLVIVSAPAHGSVCIDVTGVLTYTPRTEYVGTDTLSYTVRDDDGAASNEAAVTVKVHGVSLEPHVLFLPLLIREARPAPSAVSDSIILGGSSGRLPSSRCSPRPVGVAPSAATSQTLPTRTVKVPPQNQSKTRDRQGSRCMV
jgi:hypothetical protein